jgi:TP901 family phage tail tape measure protein
MQDTIGQGARIISASADTATGSINTLQIAFRGASEEASKSAGFLSTIADKLSFVGRVAAGITVAMIMFEMSRAVSEAVNSFVSMEQRVTTLAAISTSTGEAFRAMRAELMTASKSLSYEFAISVDEASSALGGLIKAGLDTKDAIETARNVIILAKLDMIDISTATKNVIMVMSQFQMGADQATRAVNALINMSRLGIGSATDFARGLGQAGAAARLMGLSIEEAGAIMVTLEKVFGSAEEAGVRFNRGLRELFEVAAKLGVPIRDATGALRDTISIMRDIMTVIQSYGNSLDVLTDKLRGVNERTIQFYYTMAQNSREFERNLKEMTEGGRTAFDAFVLSLDTTRASVEYTTKSMENRFGEFFASIYKGFMVGAFTFGMGTGIIEKNMETLAVQAANLINTIKETGQTFAISPTMGMIDYGKQLENIIREMATLEAKTQGTTATTMNLVNSLAGGTVMYERLKKVVEDVATQHGVLTYRLNETSKELDTINRKLVMEREALDSVILALSKLEEASSKAGKAFKMVFQDTELGAVAVAVAFMRWVETMKDVETEQQNLLNQFGGLNQLSKSWEEYGQKFIDATVKAVQEGKISVSDAMDVFKQLNSILGDTAVPLDEIGRLLEEAARNSPQAQKEFERLSKEFARLKEAAEEAASSIEKLVRDALDPSKGAGMFSNVLERINSTVKDLEKRGIKLDFSQAMKDAIDFLNTINNMTIQIQIQMQTLSFASNVIGAVSTGYRFMAEWSGRWTDTARRGMTDLIRMLREKNSLSREELQYSRDVLDFLLKEQLITQDEARNLEYLINLKRNNMKLSKDQLSFLEDLEERSKKHNQATLEQNATLERLNRIQQAAGMQGQFLGLTLQALQLAFFGGKEAARAILPFLHAFRDAMEDGKITSEEEINILKTLGITFDEQGNPIVNFTELLDTLIGTIEKTVDKIGSLIDALNSIPTNIVITITTQYRTEGSPPSGYQGAAGDLWGGTTSYPQYNDPFYMGNPPSYTPSGGGGGSGGSSSSSSSGYQGVAGDLWAFQSGAWRIPRTMPAILHRDEMVLPAEIAEEFRTLIRVMRNRSDIATNATINIYASPGMDTRELAKAVAEEIYASRRRKPA